MTLPNPEVSSGGRTMELPDNCPRSYTHTRRERLLNLLRSRTQAERAWTLEELAAALYCSESTVQRALAWLRAFGYLPPP
jgi:AraC-like DNA-binding protein